MGSFRVQIQVSDAAAGRFESIEALVDTGSTYTWVPRDLLERLGVRPDEERPFVLTDGRQVSYPIAWIHVRIEPPTLAERLTASTPSLGV